jgi:Ca-activated chloride channel family protein
MQAVNLGCGAAVLLASALLGAPAIFHGSANLVLIHATVLDRHNRPVRSLNRQQFRVFEDKVEQPISSFAEEELPLSLAVIFDTSGSMAGKISQAREALNAVLRDSNSADEFCLITFADRPELEMPWTRDAGELQSRELFAKARGLTALLDAVSLGAAQMRSSRNPRRALLILSDGGDNHSRHSPGEISRLLEESDMEVYAIDMSPSSLVLNRSLEEAEGPNLLDTLCDRAGGRYFPVEGASQLNAAATQISRELRSQYLLGYTPLNRNEDGRYRHVQLRVSPASGSSKVSVYWRRGYRAPSANRSAD